MIKTAIKNFINSLGYDIRKIPHAASARPPHPQAAVKQEKKPQPPAKSQTIDTLLAALSAASGRKLNIVQVGANDGVTNDPIYLYSMQYAQELLLIEPQTKLIEQLRTNYEKFPGKLNIVNEAISLDQEELILYELKDEIAQSYNQKTGFNPTGIVSTNKEHLIAHLLQYKIVEASEANDTVRKVVVPASTLEKKLIAKNIQQVDFLQIDVEGYDWVVIQSLGEHRPKAINIEWVHLSDEDKESCTAWLNANGYKKYMNDRDCIMIHCPALSNGSVSTSR